MKNLTLIIPAKNEADSLPTVLEEIKDYQCEIIIILEPTDTETINSTKNYNCKLIYQLHLIYYKVMINMKTITIIRMMIVIRSIIIYS